MSIFKASKISLGQTSVGQQLRVTREKKGLELSLVAEETKINLKYLHALESGEYHKLPEGIYVLNFLREYAQFLGLDYKILQTNYQEEQKRSSNSLNNALFNRQVVKERSLLVWPNLIRSFIWFFLLSACLVYLIYVLYGIFKAPLLVVYTPGDNLITSENIILVSGRTEPETEVTINKEITMVDKSGDFNQQVILQEGVNTIVIDARKGNKKPSRVVKEVLLNKGLGEKSN